MMIWFVLVYFLTGVLVSGVGLTWERLHDFPEKRSQITPGSFLALTAIWPVAVIYLLVVTPYKLAAVYLKWLERRAKYGPVMQDSPNECGSCGRSLPAAARYCRQCGKRVGTIARPLTPTGARP